jgi:hypothetical protein
MKKRFYLTLLVLAVLLLALPGAAAKAVKQVTERAQRYVRVDLSRPRSGVQRSTR